MLEPCADVVLPGMYFSLELCGNASRQEGISQVILKWIQALRGFTLRAHSVHMILYGINKISSAGSHSTQIFFAWQISAVFLSVGAQNTTQCIRSKTQLRTKRSTQPY